MKIEEEDIYSRLLIFRLNFLIIRLRHPLQQWIISLQSLVFNLDFLHFQKYKQII